MGMATVEKLGESCRYHLVFFAGLDENEADKIKANEEGNLKIFVDIWFWGHCLHVMNNDDILSQHCDPSSKLP